MLIDFEEVKHKLNSSKWYGTQAWYEILDIIGDCDDKGRLISKVYPCDFCKHREFCFDCSVVQHHMILRIENKECCTDERRLDKI